MQNKIKTIFLLLAIVSLGFFLRSYGIDSAPPGVYPDEAVNGIDALDAISSGEYQWFYPANQGREGLFMNLVALSFKILGVSAFSLKFPAMIFGTLTVLGVYFLSRELFQSSRIGLLSSFLTAVSFWAISFSRISFRANMVPAILAFSFYFIFKGMRTRKWLDFAIGGFIFGLGLHTYIAFRIAPLILVAMLPFLILAREKFFKHYTVLISVFVIFAAVSASPMLYTFFVSHPEYWVSRTGNISILNPEINQGNLPQTFLKTFGMSLAKYNFWGDQNWRHNYPPYAILDPLTGIAFLFGIIYSLIKIFHLLFIRIFKKIRDEKLEKYAFLVICFFAMLVPEIMGYEGNPHALRAIGTIPVVFIFSGLTFNYILGKARGKSYLFGKTVSMLAILMLLSIGVFNSVKYFVFWAKNPKTAVSFEKNITDMVRYSKNIPGGKEVYLIADNMQRVTFHLFSYNKPAFHNLHPVDMEKVQPENPDNLIILFTDYQKDEIINNFKNKFPNLSFEEKRDEFGLAFYILK